MTLLLCLTGLLQAASRLQTPPSLDPGADVLCNLCQKLQSKALTFEKEHREQILKIAQAACKMKGESRLCDYFAQLFARNLLSKKNSFLEKTDYFCANLISICPKKYVEFDNKNFAKEIDKKYPKIDKNFVNNSASFSAISFNDIHLQLDYETGSESQCGQPGGCCSAQYGFPTDPAHQAGYWGTAHRLCDVPVRTLDAASEYIKYHMEKPDFIFLLGDFVAHNYFTKTDEELVDATEAVVSRFHTDFPDVTIVPVLGNHECHVVDNYDFDAPDNWINNRILPIFERLIGRERVRQFVENGFYEIEKPEKNVKIIALNSQLWDGYNSFNVGQSETFIAVLDKLAASIYRSEKAGQKVVLLTHIPIVSTLTIPEVSDAFKSIILRFKSTIIAFLSAHTHTDEIKFIRDDTGRLIMANFISPSLTTDCVNPSFRLYQFDRDQLANYEQYNMDLNKHNQKAKSGDFSVEFKKSYDFLSEYGLADLGAESLEILSQKIQNRDEKTMKKYMGHRWCENHREKWWEGADSAICQTLDDVVAVERCLRQNTSGGLMGHLIQWAFKLVWNHPMMVPARSQLVY